MRAAVVDASVAVKWVVAEDQSEHAARLLQCETLHAPSHWCAEAVNALWAKVARGDLAAAEAAERVIVLMRAPIIAEPIAGLMSRAFSLSLAHAITVYDSLYVALAVERAAPLVTADAKLVRRLAGTTAFAGLLFSLADT